VESPPTSMSAAPSAAMSKQCSTAAFTERVKRPPSEKEIGREVRTPRPPDGLRSRVHVAPRSANGRDGMGWNGSTAVPSRCISSTRRLRAERLKVIALHGSIVPHRPPDRPKARGGLLVEHRPETRGGWASARHEVPSALMSMVS